MLETYNLVAGDEGEQALWQANVIKEDGKFFDLSGEPIRIVGSWKEGMPLMPDREGNYVPDEESAENGRVGIYRASPDATVVVQARTGPPCERNPYAHL